MDLSALKDRTIRKKKREILVFVESEWVTEEVETGEPREQNSVTAPQRGCRDQGNVWGTWCQTADGSSWDQLGPFLLKTATAIQSSYIKYRHAEELKSEIRVGYVKQFGVIFMVSTMVDGPWAKMLKKLGDVDFEGKMRQTKGDSGRTAADSV